MRKMFIKNAKFYKNEGIVTSPTQQTFLKNELKEIIIELISNSTVHALPKVFTKHQIHLKIMWGLFFIGCTLACGFIVVNFIITYLTFATNVNVAIINESPIDFPAITFCNLNPFNTRNVETQDYINMILEKNNLSYLLTMTEIDWNETAFSLANKALDLIKASAASNNSSKARKKLGFQIDEMLLSCRYNGDKCSAVDFTWFQSYDYGNCYTFNSGKNSNGSKLSIKTSSVSGPNYGLQMELFTGDSTRDEKFVWSSGIYILIQNQSITPLTESEGVHAATGFETHFSVKTVFTKKLPSPYSSCLKYNTDPSSYSSDLYKAIFENLKHTTYRQKYCYRLCYQQNVIKDCSCADSSLPTPFSKYNDKEILACLNFTELECLAKTKTRFQNSPISSQCSTDCPLECSTVSYSTEVSVSAYPTYFYSKWLQMQTNLVERFKNNKTTFEEIKSSVVKVNIFYNDMSYTTVTETESLSWDTLLGNIGGMLGLFLGMSLLSLVEILELILELFRACFCFRNK
jgi:acid-sensing ion channel 5